MLLKQIKQVFCGLGAGLVLLFVVNTVVGLNDAHNQVREIPILIARIERLEGVVTTLSESQAITNKSQRDIVGITAELQGTVLLLTRALGQTVGVKQDDN